MKNSDNNKEKNIKEIIKYIHSEQTISKASEIFKILSDNTRLKIIISLKKNELCVSQICEIIGISQSAISHQLSILKKLNLVKNKRIGKQIYYSLDDKHVIDIISNCLENLQHK